jgi:hypothetical protein
VGVTLGTVVRLQVQRSRLKPGVAPHRTYDPAPLLEVEALDVGPRGVRGVVPGGTVLDVHHADHPDTRNVRLRNGLSLLPRAHYERMRAAYGPHLVDGSAGESLLLDTDGPLVLDNLAGDLELETADGSWLALRAARVAAPCVEFSRFALGVEGSGVDDAVRAALTDLDDGVRGFYVEVAGEGSVVARAILRRA